MASFLIALLNVISVMESANDNLTVGVSWSHFISSSINCVLPLPCRGGLSQISHGRGPKRNTTQIEVNDVTIAIDRIGFLYADVAYCVRLQDLAPVYLVVTAIW